MKANEVAILLVDYLNELKGGRGFSHSKSNLQHIAARYREKPKEQTAEEFIKESKEVIQVKTLDWKNNLTMRQHLNPTTLFRKSNFEKYLIQVEDVKSNTELYARYFAGNKSFSASSTAVDAGIDAMFD